jgi:hypothetical protein
MKQAIRLFCVLLNIPKAQYELVSASYTFATGGRREFASSKEASTAAREI